MKLKRKLFFNYLKMFLLFFIVDKFARTSPKAKNYIFYIY